MNRKFLIAASALSLLVVPALANWAESGLNVGETVTPFYPSHIAGPDKGTKNCPPCTYGNRPAVQVWFHNEDKNNAAGILTALHTAVETNKSKEFKAFGIFVADCEMCITNTNAIVEMLKFNNVGIATVTHDDPAPKNYKIDTSEEVKNTVLVYVNKKVVAKLVNVKADKAGLAKLNEAITKAL